MLTSAKNPKVAAAIRLRKRALRDRDQRFLVEGAQTVGAALEEPGHLETLFVTEGVDALADRGRRSGVDVQVVSPDVMQRLTDTVTPQGLVGVAPFVDVSLAEVPVGGCTAILHEVRDPGNAGTVIRSADASGASGVVVTSSSVDAYNAKVVRASAGSIFHLPIVRGLETAEAIDQLRTRGVRILAMDASGPLELYDADLSGPLAFVFGNEAHGLPPDVIARADVAVRVPQAGRAESLNLAAAATVCLFEWARRRRRGADALEAVIAAAAHDIRSPLTAMKGFGYALEQRWDEMPEDQRRLMLGGIVYDADRMDTMLRQLVDAARVVGNTFEAFPTQVDVGDVVRGVAGSLSRDPEHPPVEWTGPEAMAFVDPARLRTAISSFLEALVWWAHDGPVEVEGAVAGGRLHVRAGRGGTELSTEGAENLFRPRRPGTGGGSKIGLHVTRAVAEAQGGRAWAEVLDGRVVFHLELPSG